MVVNHPKSIKIVQQVMDTYEEAEEFLPVMGRGRTSWSKTIIGWTFRVRNKGFNQYGWATTEGFVFTDLCSSRRSAERILHKVVRDEEARKQRKND